MAKLAEMSPIPEERKSRINPDAVKTAQEENGSASNDSDSVHDSTSNDTSTQQMRTLVRNFEQTDIPSTTSLSTTIDPDGSEKGENRLGDTSSLQDAQRNDIGSSPNDSDIKQLYQEGTEENTEQDSTKEIISDAIVSNVPDEESTPESVGTASANSQVEDPSDSDGGAATKNSEILVVKTTLAEQGDHTVSSTSDSPAAEHCTGSEETPKYTDIPMVETTVAEQGDLSVSSNSDPPAAEQCMETDKAPRNSIAKQGNLAVSSNSDPHVHEDGTAAEDTPKNSDIADNSNDKIDDLDGSGISETVKQNYVPQEGKPSSVTSKRCRVGMSGPAFTKKLLNVSLADISEELHLRESDEILQVRDTPKKDVILKFACQKCPEMFFRIEGYDQHLFDLHKIRKLEAHPPAIYQKTLSCLNLKTNKKEDTYKTTFTKMTRREQKVELKKTEIKSDVSKMTIPTKEEVATMISRRKRSAEGDADNRPIRAASSERDFKCELCPEKFFYVTGLGTHMVHVHGSQTHDSQEDTSGMPHINPPNRSSRSSSHLAAAKTGVRNCG